MALSGMLLAPVDVLLQRVEQREYARGERPRKPIIIVVGPPRSGTTLVAQYLINALEVAYINNLTSLFPRSPVTINRLLGRFVPFREGAYEAFYGRSRRLAGVNDGLYIWDRWLGSDRRDSPDSLSTGAEQSMRRFFAAFERYSNLPMVTKVNRLNTCANLIAEVLDNTTFVCLHRNPLYLAQSLYIARQTISGNMRSAYGVRHENSCPEDPVEDVCRQVDFHIGQAQRQQEILGPSKFLVISYEKFCESPEGLVNLMLSQHRGLSLRSTAGALPKSFSVSVQQKVGDHIFERMRGRLSELCADRLILRDF